MPKPVRDQLTRSYPIGYTPLGGIDVRPVGGSGSETWGPFEPWICMQFHGLVDDSLVYTLVGPPGSFSGMGPTQAPLINRTAPIRMPPGARLTVSNLRAASQTVSVVFWEGTE